MIVDKLDWVKEQLVKNPKFRDSNEGLYYTYLKEIGYDINTPLKQFLKDMESRTIPYIDSFGRASRKIQEEHPHLRGKLYKQRKAKQDEVKDEIINL